MVSVNPVGLTTTYVSTTCAEPEVAVEFLNYGFTAEGRKLVNYGISGMTYTEDENGDVAFTDLILANPDGYTFDQAQVMYLVSNWMPTAQDDSYLKVNYTDEAIEAITLWSTVGDDTMTIPQAAQPGGDDMMEIFTMASDSLTYLSTVAPKVILGTATGDDYRAAVQECMDNMNLGEITEMYQAAYDAYLAS
jgi:putative aldouronate transport system substrate-binding protein